MADRDAVDAVVIGSGFGGGVAAARLAQAGLSVRVLERGRRWAAGDFPRDTADLDRGWLWAEGRGLYDIRWLDTMVGVQAAGWGGGSLVYANVFARPLPEVFDAWPGGFDRAALDPYYDLAAHMLRVQPVGTDPLTGNVPARTAAMEVAVARLHRPAGTVRPLLAVNFAVPERTPHDGECTFVGECMFGCNQGAKNSVDRTYLAVAERHGAIASTLCEVDRIVPQPAGGYAVEFVDHARAGERRSVLARNVFLAAGAVAATELLLRNRDEHGTFGSSHRRSDADSPATAISWPSSAVPASRCSPGAVRRSRRPRSWTATSAASACGSRCRMARTPRRSPSSCGRSIRCTGVAVELGGGSRVAGGQTRRCRC